MLFLKVDNTPDKVESLPIVEFSDKVRIYTHLDELILFQFSCNILEDAVIVDLRTCAISSNRCSWCCIK